MSTQEQARQQAAEQRLHDDNRQRSLLERSTAEVTEIDIDDAEIQAETRESLASQRQKDHNRRLSAQQRTEAELES
ncbi:hypothetical protein C7271_11705 [filamentous cyanobacterium CCP5]|nr:hypothetical protein C7271_11705 [filamentous cyanobacterium CCP5]